MVIEVKLTKKGSIPFSCLMAHQEEKLLEAERVLAHKIADVGLAKKPSDILIVAEALSIVLVIFYKPRASEIFEIPIRTFIDARERTVGKSLTLKHAAMIGQRITFQGLGIY